MDKQHSKIPKGGILCQAVRKEKKNKIGNKMPGCILAGLATFWLVWPKTNTANK
jgi:hypothetical protein